MKERTQVTNIRNERRGLGHCSYNPSYMGGRDGEHYDLRANLGKKTLKYQLSHQGTLGPDGFTSECY
jgi:hypothetical protein